jgi:hypothetical protein
MSREIKFRAREITRGSDRPDKWVYGDYLSRFEGAPSKVAVHHIIEHPHGDRETGREVIWKIDPRPRLENGAASKTSVALIFTREM